MMCVYVIHMTKTYVFACKYVRRFFMELSRIIIIFIDVYEITYEILIMLDKQKMSYCRP
jgi:hypothetical protein